MSDSLRAIAEELQNAYGVAALTQLDYDTASAIERRLRAEGWASPEDVRVLVASAGGRIEIDEHSVIDPPKEMRRTDDPVTGARVVEVR